MFTSSLIAGFICIFSETSQLIGKLGNCLGILAKTTLNLSPDTIDGDKTFINPSWWQSVRSSLRSWQWRRDRAKCRRPTHANSFLRCWSRPRPDRDRHELSALPREFPPDQRGQKSQSWLQTPVMAKYRMQHTYHLSLTNFIIPGKNINMKPSCNRIADRTAPRKTI